MKVLNSAFRGIRNRLPLRSDIWTVFNIVLFVVYGWSIRGFLFELPSFSLYFRLWNLTGILFYMFAFALLETLIVTGVLVVVSVFLPSAWFKHGFAYKGFLVVVVATVAAILFQGYYKIEFFQDIGRNDYSSLWHLLQGFGVAVAVLAVLIWVFRRYEVPQRRLLALADQFSVFTYIYVPLGLVGLVMVIVRNIL